MPDSLTIIPKDYSSSPEKNAFILAEQGTLEIIELMGAADRLKSAGLKDQTISLYRLWLEHTKSPLVYIGYFNLGVELASERDYIQAEAMYRKALELSPDFVRARLNLGNCLEQQKRDDEALEEWRTALKSESILLPENQPLRLHALNNLGRLLEIKKNYKDSLDKLEESFSVDPTQRDVLLHLVHLVQKICRWPVYAPPKGISKQEMINGTSPLAMLAASDDPKLQLAAAQQFVEHKYPVTSSESLAPKGGYKHDKIRIGYLSSDFCLHAVSLLMVELLELHDHDKFEIYGFCWSRVDDTSIQKRVQKSMDHYIKIGEMSDKEAADCIRLHEIDIMIDLQGLTSGARPMILSYRPAMLQMTYLGFPGTTGLPWIDYVIADKYLIPEELVPYHTEKPLYMPNCFQSSDSKREVGPMPTRADNGLPEKAFVFCSFNNNYKFTPEVFAAWMRIIKRVPGSVFWLLADNEWSKENLLKEAKKHGIKKERLIFAPRVAPADYLARYQLADLFLDTFPFNGGTTANDALFMGLPLLTLSGRTFASRMAGSLLTHLGLPELIATNLKEYEEKAVRFAKKTAELNILKSHLMKNKESGSVFNISIFVKGYETNIINKLNEHMLADIQNTKGTKANSTFSDTETSIHNASIVDTAGADTKSLLVQGWTGINHSFAMVNQYQLLALASDKNLNLFQQEMPYFNNQWNKDKNSAGFSSVEQQQLARIKSHSGEAVSAIYRIHSPYNLKNAEVKVVSFIITELGLDQKSFPETLDIRSYEKAGNLVVTSSFWSRERIIDFGFSPDCVLVIPCGVSTEKFSPLNRVARDAARTALGYNEEDIVFLNVGAPLWNKGMDLILKAYFRVREKHKNVRLLIKDQQSLYGLSAQNMISNLASSGDIRLENESIESIKVIPSTLSIEQLRSLYSLSDYYVSPYRAEGFNLPVVEAIACGTKVIVTAGGSTDDFCDALTSIKIPSIKHEHAVVQNTNISAYLEPDLDALVDIWCTCASGSTIDPLHFSFGRCNLAETFTWDRAAKLLTSLI